MTNTSDRRISVVDIIDILRKGPDRPPLVNFMSTTEQVNGTSKIQFFGRQYTIFFPDLLSAPKMVRVIEGKII